MIEDGETWSTASRHIIEDAAAAGVTPDGDPTGEDPTPEAQAIARALFAARCAGIENEFERERYLVPGTFREAYAGVETFVAELADYGYTISALSTTPALAAAHAKVIALGCIRMHWGADRPCGEYDDGRDLCGPCALRAALKGDTP